jgi:hypothetical protein
MENHPVISVHEYELKPGVDEIKFELAFKEAEARGLFDLPGLVDFHFVKGIRGVRRGKYGVIWIYESMLAWEQLWGPVDRPIPKEQYPDKWLTWEDEVLAPFISQDPDEITFNSYLAL